MALADDAIKSQRQILRGISRIHQRRASRFQLQEVSGKYLAKPAAISGSLYREQKRRETGGRERDKARARELRKACSAEIA
jgi:hypothetical protein